MATEAEIQDTKRKMVARLAPRMADLIVLVPPPWRDQALVVLTDLLNEMMDLTIEKCNAVSGVTLTAGPRLPFDPRSL